MTAVIMVFVVVPLISYVNAIQDSKEMTVPKLFVKYHAMKMNIVMFLQTNPFVNANQATAEQVVLSNCVKMTVLIKESAKMEFVSATMVSEETAVVSNYVLKIVPKMGFVKMGHANVSMDTWASTAKKRVVQ